MSEQLPRPDQAQIEASNFMRDEIMQIIRRYDLTVFQSIGVLEVVKFELIGMLPFIQDRRES